MNTKNPKYFSNREISWLDFNQRVLQEARDVRNPLLERVKYLAIVANNLDEFFEIRVAGLLQQIEADIADHSADGLLPEEQFHQVTEIAHRMVGEQYDCWNNELLPALKAADVHIRNLDQLTKAEDAFIRRYCERDLHPVLTPLTVNPAHPFPRILNKALCIGVLLQADDGENFFGVVQVPRLLPRRQL